MGRPVPMLPRLGRSQTQDQCAHTTRARSSATALWIAAAIFQIRATFAAGLRFNGGAHLVGVPKFPASIASAAPADLPSPQPHVPLNYLATAAARRWQLSGWKL